MLRNGLCNFCSDRKMQELRVFLFAQQQHGRKNNNPVGNMDLTGNPGFKFLHLQDLTWLGQLSVFAQLLLPFCGAFEQSRQL